MQTAFYVVLFLVLLATTPPRARRWLLWTFRCHRGRRCANLMLDEIEAKRMIAGKHWETVGGEEFDQLTAGGMVYIDYECTACGTRYRGSSIIGRDGSFTETIREIRV